MKRGKQGNHHDLRAIARRAMVQYGLEPEFSAAVRSEAAGMKVATGVPAARDLSGLPWCSIDNDDSLDLDQLTVAEELPDGSVLVRVAIADVDEVVGKSSAVDGHARANTTSVYTAAGVFPMLPERLSTDLTSLGENQDRLAVVVEMRIGAKGFVDESSIYRAVVRNQAKLAYNALAPWLEGDGPAPAPLSAVPGLDVVIRLQDRVAGMLKDQRHKAGALSLKTIEARAVFAGDTLAGLEAARHNRATDLIEDFMIAANGVAVRHLRERGFPSMRRVLRSPERWQRIVELAAGYQEILPPEPDVRSLEAFLRKRNAAEPDTFPDLSLTVVKLMGRGEYVAEAPGGDFPGHFGLAVKDYTHSTAPNRRFPDLVTQRLLKASLSGQPVPYGTEELAGLARHCTEMEDAAGKVERLVLKSAGAVVLEGKIGQRFDGIVTGASAKGTWVRIFDPPLEGKLVEGFAGLDVGDRVRVKLVRTDVERGFIDFVR